MKKQCRILTTSESDKGIDEDRPSRRPNCVDSIPDCTFVQSGTFGMFGDPARLAHRLPVLYNEVFEKGKFL